MGAFSGAWVTAAVAIGIAFGWAGPASADPVEDRLRAWETATLGAEHAAAHARQRELASAEARSAGSASESEAAADASAGAPEEVGAWSAPVPVPVLAINVALLPTGRVLMFAYPERPRPGDYQNLAHAYVWDPATGASKRVDPPDDPATGDPTNIWCGGTSFLTDGRVLVTGGNVGDPTQDFEGLPTVFTFDPFTETWSQHESMAQGRWYPSQLLMPDGRTLILSGLTAPGDRDYPMPRVNTDVEVFSPDGSIARFDELRLGEAGNPPLPGLYPHTFWLRSGRALVAGPKAKDTWLMDAPRRGAANRWTDVPDLSMRREWGTAVMLEDGQVMTLGGSEHDGTVYRLPTRTTEIFDERDAAAGWRPGPPLAVERSHANSVLLPDGTVATVGGGYGEIWTEDHYRWKYDPARHTRVELHDPRTGRVTLGPPQSEGRTYHSVALLLPDGRVMSAGDDINGRPTAEHPDGAGTGTREDTAELYSPPYLFRGPRPRIDAAPAAIPYGHAFGVRTPDADVTRAVLVAPGAVTHAVDFNQRVVALDTPVRVRGEGVNLRAPASVDAAPPGWYMLFLMNDRGVPSVARFVRLDPSAPAAPVLVAAPDSGGAAPTTTTPSTTTPSTTTTTTRSSPVEREARSRLRLSGRLPTLRRLLRRGWFTMRVRLDRPGRVALSAGVERRRRTLSIARKRVVRFRAAGRRRVRIRLTRTGIRRLRRIDRRAVIRVEARAHVRNRAPVVRIARRRAR